MAMSKVKILVFGSITNAENEKAFSTKLQALNKSKAGPFHVVFVVGRSTISEAMASPPIPVYLHDASLPDSLATSSNLKVLSKGVSSISTDAGELIVANLPWNLRVEAQSDLVEHLQHPSYTGCDVLLSHEWPQGIESCLSESTTTTTPSFDVAHVALLARARYHLAPADAAVFCQSAAFDHLSAVTHTTQTLHVGRFIAIPSVTVKPTTKANKFVHAVGIAPLHSLSTVDLHQQRPATVKACPFTDASYEKIGKSQGNKTMGSSTGGLSEASVRRILHEEQSQNGSNQHRWATGNKRSRQEEERPVDPTCTVLFLHGLHHDVSGRLQVAEAGDPLLRNVFSRFSGFQSSIRRPATSSSFCFLEFSTHEQAAKCLEELAGHVDVTGVRLTVRWGTNNNRQADNNPKRQRLTESEAKDSTVVYFKLPPGVSDVPAAAEALRKWMEKTLEEALANPDEDAENVTAETEPALRVQFRLPKQDGAAFGFLDFASHAAASMALASLTGSTDGGQLQADASGMPLPELQGLYLHWAKADNIKQTGMIEDSSGFRFQRQHFPADARQDCWFCLASDTCEKHLITGVYNLCYTTMPKGPVHPGHALIVPVHHSSRGALVDKAVAEEVENLKEVLRRHASTTYDMDLFVFERAIQTKHGYHSHVQCIPVERDLGIKIHATMVGQAKSVGMALRELGSDLNLTAVLSDEDEQDAGYFYAEIPSRNLQYKRFLYKHDGTTRVPLQFGREVLAAVMGKPQLAHWKACVLDQEQETTLAANLRESLEKLD